MSTKINAEWHKTHPLPKNPTLDQRLAWHLEHAKYCRCREMPAKLKAEFAKRGIKVEKPSK